MSREIFEFSALIDDEFDVVEKPVKGFFAFLISLFKLG